MVRTVDGQGSAAEAVFGGEVRDSSVLRLRISQEGQSGGAFEPLTPPRDLHLAWDESNFDRFDHLRASLSLEMEPGRHALPILHDETLLMDVASGCKCNMRITAGHMDGGKDPQAIVTDLDLVFDTPVVLYNIVPILARLHTLFRDRELTEWITRLVLAAQSPLASKGLRLLEGVSRMAGGGLLGRLIPTPDQVGDWIEKGLEALRNSSDNTAVVRLNRVRATPVQRDGEWQLDFRFTGEVVYFGSATFPFTDFRVPRIVIPSAHAALKKLATGHPIATASVRTDRMPGSTLLTVLANMVTAVEGDLAFGGDTPDLAIEVVVAGGGCAATYVSTEGKTEGRLKLSSVVEQSRIGVALEGFELKTGEATAAFDGHLELELSESEEMGPKGGPRTVTTVLLEDLLNGTWSSARYVIKSGFSVREGAKAPPIGVKFGYEHPLLKGSLKLNGRVEELCFGGSGQFRSGGADGQQEETVELPFSCTLVAEPGSMLSKDDSVVGSSRAKIRLSGKVVAEGPGRYSTKLDGSSDLHLHSTTPVRPFPEFSIDESALVASVEARASFSVVARSVREGSQPAVLDFSGSAFQATLERARLELDGRLLLLPEAADVWISARDAMLATTGLGHSSVELKWDFHGHSPMLHGKGRIIDVLVPELRTGEVVVHISPAGGLSVSGPEWGLWDAHLFNALLHPTQETRRVVELLQAEEVVDKATAVVEVFSPELSLWLERFRSFAARVRRVLDEEGISEISHVIPAPRLAKFCARLLSDEPGLETRVLPIVMGVVEGRGLDVPAVKRLVFDLYPDHGWEFEIDRGLRWLNNLLKPGDPPPAWECVRSPALAEDPKYIKAFEAIPSATRLYRVVDSAAPLPAGFSASVARIAAYMTLEQLEYIVGRNRSDWAPEDLARLQRVLELKRRVQMVRCDFGGVTFAPQAMAISFFLGNAVSVSRASQEARQQREGEPPEFIAGTLLGPEDVAAVLKAGMAAVWAGRSVQVNQRRLLNLVFGLPPAFLHSVLIELGENDHRVLTGALNVLLNMPQDLLREPLDMVAELHSRLQLPFPRIEDFLAGGRWAKLSYYEALAAVAEQILSQAEPYRALKFFIQEVRHPVAHSNHQSKSVQSLANKAQQAIERADEQGARCSFKAARTTRRSTAVSAYQEAFARCSDLLKADRQAFQLPWFKAFWARNYEALMVYSVVRNVQQGIDKVGPWVQLRTQRPLEEAEQTLLDQVIDALYYYEADRATLKADPLVRLLIEPDSGPLNFTIVSCMGVVTEGAEGTELEDAYARLEQLHSVKVVRADTATAKSLDHNADRIIEAIAKVTTPYGLVGYSQGCANALMAEARLMGGTPQQQAQLQGLLSRNLLFSALNGSSHGTCGDVKFGKAMVELDRFLGHYQAVLSRRGIDLFLSTFRSVLDSRLVVEGILGTRSVARWGLIPLQRGGQFKPNCPTTILRGIVEPQNMPEALEFLANSLTHQNESALHDTQVEVNDAVGHFRLTQNPQADLLARCDIGCMVQRSHHWSPLLKETRFLTTQRDIDRAVFEAPKDRHVFPWINVNVRFGVISKA